jgi:hypothetical protein
MLLAKALSAGIIGMIFACSPACGAAPSQPAPSSTPIPPAPPPLFPRLSFANLTDHVLAAQIVALVQVADASRLKGELAPGLSASFARFLITANVQSLLTVRADKAQSGAADGLPGTISYIIDLPLDARGKAPNVKKRQFLLLANRVPGRPAELRLISPDSQVDWTQEEERRIRDILIAASASDAPPRITGIGSAFHVPGAIPGESETQIFLTTDSGRPVSLNVLRRPGEAPHWAVSLAEIVDDSAEPPHRDTMLWYRLACFLPAELPDGAIASMSPDDSAAARADYAVVLKGLGDCGRSAPK